MQTDAFDYTLPHELIAQTPAAERDQSRLLVLDRATEKIQHRQFFDVVEFLKAGDVLVLNNSRVIPARLRGLNPKTGGHFEIVLLEEIGINDWWAMLKPGRRGPLSTEIEILRDANERTSISAMVSEMDNEGHRRLKFSGIANIRDALDNLGEMPVPPYIKHKHADELALDKNRYQTVYAKPDGSVAAPTAGLHFTEDLLTEIRSRGVNVCFVTLHVGLGTFAPVKSKSVEDHIMHEERYELGEDVAKIINQAKSEGRRVIAVGTTTVRVLESVAVQNDGRIKAGSGHTRIFIYPPYQFRIVDALLTNFHLPCSTLLMLVSAFALPGKTRGREIILRTYAAAVRQQYRFFSYGDAMLLI